VELRIEGPSDRLDGLGSGLAQGGDEEAVRGRHALVEVRVGGARREGPLERVEHGQEGQQRGAAALAASRLLLACHAAPQVVKVGEQPKMALFGLVEGAAQALDFLSLDAAIAHIGR
jgi:hypothetical protein